MAKIAYGVIGEDDSDVETVVELIKRIANNKSLSIKRKGYNGCGEMFIKAPMQLSAWSEMGCEHFIICYDSDRDKPEARYEKLVAAIKESDVPGTYCALVPIQEIEAWILADLEAVSKVITGWRPPGKEIVTPEAQRDPKEHLEGLTKMQNSRPRYNHAMHNPAVAKHLNLDKVLKKCPSFGPLFEMVAQGSGNVTVP